MTTTAVKERPIFFSAPMVRAILDGRKTQTRRVVKLIQLAEDHGKPMLETGWNDTSYAPNPCLKVTFDGNGEKDTQTTHRHFCPYGNVGDRLWVREACRFGEEWNDTKPSDVPPHAWNTKGEMHGVIRYEADGGDLEGWGKLRPGMFMPRWASRIDLEIVTVRVERVQDISDADAVAEGWPAATEKIGCCKSDPPCTYDNVTKGQYAAALGDDSAIEWFAELWDSINGAGSWESNPWVWVIDFKRKESK